MSIVNEKLLRQADERISKVRSEEPERYLRIANVMTFDERPKILTGISPLNGNYEFDHKRLVTYIQKHLLGESVECMVIVPIDGHGHALGAFRVGRGAAILSVVDFREIVRVFFSCAAEFPIGVVLAHNHPVLSLVGKKSATHPSDLDRMMTRLFEEFFIKLQIIPLDSVIVASTKDYYSMRKKGDMRTFFQTPEGDLELSPMTEKEAKAEARRAAAVAAAEAKKRGKKKRSGKDVFGEFFDVVGDGIPAVGEVKEAGRKAKKKPGRVGGKRDVIDDEYEDV